MRVWLTCFVLVFGMAEFYQWVKHFTVPLPVFILAGGLLAIASNYGKYAGWSFQQPDQAEASQGQSPSIGTKQANWATLNSSAATPMPKATRPISFTISRPTQERAREDRRG
ncbi:MAG: hypothetical protein F6K28_41695 [Microcoleus sp. SIO2G3]|nr:hypothetical protein [Microcoleus sp. SIO2G3]